MWEIPLWSHEGLLGVDLGLLSLGDVVVPVFPAGSTESSRVKVQSTTYRAEQSQGWLRWVASHPRTGMDKAVIVAERCMSFPKGRAGEFRIDLRCELIPGRCLRAKPEARGLLNAEQETFDVLLPQTLIDCRRAGLSSEAFVESQRVFVNAELFLRWFRTLLREPASRREVRGRFQDFVSLCDRVEQSLRSEDVEGLRKVLGPISVAARELTERLELQSFPLSHDTVFLPES